MTKTEARKILKEHNSWRRGDTPDNALPHPSAVLGEAIDEIVKYPEIAADIRDAAIYWPIGCAYMANRRIVESFLGLYENTYRYGTEEHLTFMLFVAEALAS